MLIKEYRILLPLTVEEYRIAQLYMIQKKSRIDSHGEGAGVEIIMNKPYDNGPGGSGQYTFKIFHIASKIPGWIRNVLPVSALEAHEEAWNNYPVTKTRYSTPLMDRFSLEVDTLYFNDAGTQDNVFNLTPTELKQRVVDVMDFVKDGVSSHDYCAEEDPKLFRSRTTGRGPLNEDWVEECMAQGTPVMCAYKLCRVEFRYWGLQTRAERWIHDLALRNTMMRAHRQAWAWQDEWYGLTIDDIRQLEMEVALHLSTVMANHKEEPSVEDSDDASSDDLYFDCTDTSPQPSAKPSIIRWSSELLLDNDSPPSTPFAKKQAALLVLVFHGDFNPDGPSDSKTTDTNTLRSTVDQLILKHYPQLVDRVHVALVSCGAELAPVVSKLAALNGTFGSTHPALGVLLSAHQTIFNEAIEGAIRRANDVYEEFTTQQPNFNGEVFVVGDSLGGLLLYEVLAYRAGSMIPHLQLTRHSSSVSSSSPSAHNSCRQSIPEGIEEVMLPNTQCIPLHPPAYSTAVPSFSPCAISTTSTGYSNSIPSYSPSAPSISPNSHHSPGGVFDSVPNTPASLNGGASIPAGTAPPPHHQRNSSAPPSASFERGQRKRHSLSNMSQTGSIRHDNSPLIFQPTTAFLLGCPLGIVLMHRKFSGLDVDAIENCQVFNLYYPLDLCGARIEPVLNSQLCILPPASVARYQRCPLGDGKSMTFDSSVDTTAMWGSKRHDHLLYCPSTMVNLPSAALPNILHASYWESCDVGAFILRQFVRGEEGHGISSASAISPSSPHAPQLSLPLPAMHWRKRRTRFKITNLSPNHRANDALVVHTSGDQVIHSRFCYGPMDLVALTRESVNIYICPARKEWYLHCVAETDSHGRLSLNLGRSLPPGIHSIKMIVQGDHSYLDAFIAVVPQDTPVVVFSIDGSLTASVSVTGRDPRVRPGAVDVARYWHDQGFLLLYVTARPDMQQRAVAGWLAQHNFPHAILYFAPSFSTDPLKQKTCYLRQLQADGVRIHAAYGSNKDVTVYHSAGVDQDRIVSVGSRKKHSGCLVVESYSSHLAELNDGTAALLIADSKRENNNENHLGHTLSLRHRPAQRSSSFTPRIGKLEHQDSKK